MTTAPATEDWKRCGSIRAAPCAFDEGGITLTIGRPWSDAKTALDQRFEGTERALTTSSSGFFLRHSGNMQTYRIRLPVDLMHLQGEGLPSYDAQPCNLAIKFWIDSNFESMFADIQQTCDSGFFAVRDKQGVHPFFDLPARIPSFLIYHGYSSLMFSSAPSHLLYGVSRRISRRSRIPSWSPSRHRCRWCRKPLPWPYP